MTPPPIGRRLDRLTESVRERLPGRGRSADDNPTGAGAGEGTGTAGAQGSAMRRWRDYREQQLQDLRESNRIHHAPGDHPAAGATAVGAAATTDGTEATTGSGHTPGEGVTGGASAFGQLGATLNRYSPFYLGFMAALGVATAYLLVGVIDRLQTTLTILLVALFLTLALNPIVESIERRGARRSVAVLLVCLGMVGVFAILAWVVVPPVVDETTQLIENAPGYAESFTQQKWVQDLDHNYQIGEKINEQVTERSTDGAFVSQVFGGVLGAGKALASGVFQAFTVLILTLYFLASLPAVKRAGYAMVPASRRPRVVSLTEEIMRRTGSYALGQVVVASINGICSWVMMTILDIPYAAVLAVVVGFLGLIPMVGATIGAVIVATVAFFVEPQKALVVGIYYLVYQQLENYVIVPKVMQRTVSVPGAVTVVAALAGGTILGVLGALLAIPVAAGLLLLYEEVLVPRQARS